MISPDRLVTELNSLGVRFLSGGDPARTEPALSPAALIAGLAEQEEARVRLALIPLFLVRPALAGAAPAALADLDAPVQVTLRCFYTAAVLLQQIHAAELRRLLGEQPVLPDHFSGELGLPSTGSPQQRLRRLGDRQRALSGLAANWPGTYQHAAERLLRQLKLERQWQP